MSNRNGPGVPLATNAIPMRSRASMPGNDATGSTISYHSAYVVNGRVTGVRPVLRVNIMIAYERPSSPFA